MYIMYFGLIHTHFPLYPVPTPADLSSSFVLYFQVFFVWPSELNWDCLWNKGKGLFIGAPDHVAPPLKKNPNPQQPKLPVDLQGSGVC